MKDPVTQEPESDLCVVDLDSMATRVGLVSGTLSVAE